jgi:hypothetical protein
MNLCRDCAGRRNVVVEMKLSRDCRWALDRGATLTQHRLDDWICRHPSAPRMPPIDYVTGQPQDPRIIYCMDMRQDRSQCGPEGRYWEAKETIT